MYELPSGNFFRRVNGFHLGTIYDIDWSFDDRFVMSASNDCTAQIWSVEKEKHSSVVLPHPCFIYSCKFCPQKEYQYLIFTGAFDGIIRLWSVRKCWENHPGLSKDPELLREIDGFQGQVLSLCFKAFPMISPRSRTGTMSAKVNNNNNNNGISSSSHQHQGFNNNYNNNIYTEELVLFSAGSNGSITLWKHKRETSTGIYDISHWLPTGKIRVPELKGIPINCIKISPSGSKMLCCCRDGVLRMIDYDL
jgi:WD40 repeat protein